MDGVLIPDPVGAEVGRGAGKWVRPASGAPGWGFLTGWMRLLELSHCETTRHQIPGPGVPRGDEGKVEESHGPAFHRAFPGGISCLS